MEAWLRNWADRWDLHVHLVNQTAMLGAINVAGPHARDLLGAPHRRSDRPGGAPVPGPRRDHGRRRGLPRDPRRVRGRALVRAAPPALAQRRAVGRADASGRGPRHRAARPRRARRAPAGEGAHLPRRRTRCPTTTRRSSGSGGPSRWTSRRSSGRPRSSAWPSSRSSASSWGSVRRDAAAGRAAVFRRTRRRPRHVVRRLRRARDTRSVSDGSAPSTACSPRRSAAGDVTADRRADSVLRPRGGETACLSSRATRVVGRRRLRHRRSARRAESSRRVSIRDRARRSHARRRPWTRARWFEMRPPSRPR